MTTISVLIPAYNNTQTITPLLVRLTAVLEDTALTHEIIVIDDGSKDETWEHVRAFSRTDSRVHAVRLSRNFGQHAAIAAALERASGDLTVLMDADLEDDPDDLPGLLEPVIAGQADIVTSLTIAGGEGKQTRPLSRLFHRTFGVLTGSEVPPNIGTFRVFNRRVADSLRSYRERGAVYGPMMSQMGFRVLYVPCSRGAWQPGASRYSFRKRWKLAWDALLSYSMLPYRLVTWLGWTVTSVSLIFLIVLGVQYTLFDVRITGGLGLLAGMLALGFGVTMLAIGALFAYQVRIFREVLGRPRYHVMDESGTGLNSEP